jgi:hypothetical protein
VGDYEENPIFTESDPEEGKACKVKREEGSGRRGARIFRYEHLRIHWKCVC